MLFVKSFIMNCFDCICNVLVCRCCWAHRLLLNISDLGLRSSLALKWKCCCIAIFFQNYSSLKVHFCVLESDIKLGTVSHLLQLKKLILCILNWKSFYFYSILFIILFVDFTSHICNFKHFWDPFCFAINLKR